MLFFCIRNFVDGVTGAGLPRAQHQTCSAPPLHQPPHSIDLERHTANFIRSFTGISGGEQGGDQGNGFWKANLPTILVPRACFDSLVVSLRAPRGSGVGPETIFTLVYTSTGSRSIVTAISDFPRSIQKLNFSHSSCPQSVNPSIQLSITPTLNQTTHQSPKCLPRPPSPRSSSPLRRSPSRPSTTPSHPTRRVGTTGTALSGLSAPSSALSVCFATITLFNQVTNIFTEANWEDRSVPPTPAVEADEPQYKN
jgi:hypothetical protein